MLKYNSEKKTPYHLVLPLLARSDLLSFSESHPFNEPCVVLIEGDSFTTITVMLSLE